MFNNNLFEKSSLLNCFIKINLLSKGTEKESVAIGDRGENGVVFMSKIWVTIKSTH